MILKRRPLVCVVLIDLMLLIGLNAAHVPLVIRPKADREATMLAEEEQPVTLIGTVLSSEAYDDYSKCLLGKVRLKTENSKKLLPISRVSVIFGEARNDRCGNVLKVSGTLQLPPRATNPGQFDSALYHRVQKIGYTMTRPSVETVSAHVDLIPEKMRQLRLALRRRLTRIYSSADAGILSAMMLGDKTLLEAEDRQTWQLGGISHMLAISGLHLTLLGMGLYGLLRKLRMGIVPSGGIAMGVLIGYAIFTGCSVSTIRALIMFLLAMGAPILGRTYDMLTALAVAVLLILLENPYYLFYSGFQLSASAVLICCLFQHRSKFTVASMLYLGMLPLVLLAGSEMPVYSMFINFLVVPLLPLILASGFLGALLGIRPAALPAAALLKLIRLVLHLFSLLPCPSLLPGHPSRWKLLLYYPLLILWAYLMKRYRNYKRRLLILLTAPILILVLSLHAPSGLTLNFYDVGQGDGCLLSCPGGEHCLIDGGSSSVREVGRYRILPALRAEGVQTLDYVILTHMDSDHINGIQELLEMVRDRQTGLRIKTVIFPYLHTTGDTDRKMQTLAKEAGCRVLTVRADDRIGIGPVTLHFLNPDPSLEGSGEVDENGQCVVTAVHYGKFDALLTGDVHGDGEQNVLRRLKTSREHYEVLKVAHHGSRLSTPSEFLEVLRPEVSVISVGAHNRYGHPGEALLARLRAVHTRIYRTDRSGCITVTSNGRGYHVEPFFTEKAKNP